MILRKLSLEFPLTYYEMAELSIRLEEIEDIINKEDCPGEVIVSLISELNNILSYLERSNKLVKIRSSQLKIVKEEILS